jgi:exodeoxyribonuclease VII large subunit
MTDTVYTISELTRIIKRNLEDNPELSGIWIIGEISNLTYHSSGHIYFTLKDENAVLSSVFFKYQNRKLSFRLEEGMSVFALGAINVFEKRGSYQFIVSEVRLEGIGELQKRIEQLKKKLLAEGLFDPKRKRRLPSLPRRIGIATSPTGAAIRDIIKVATRRFPNIELVISPAKVQGSDAAESIVRAIEALNLPELRIDVIIAGRGGGSFEDLMPFNEEVVVRAFSGSRVPIVSAVGHQVDHPLSDDAADFAAPTPSAAAEICVPVKSDLLDYIEYLTGRSNSALLSRTREASTVIAGVLNRRVFREPREIVFSRELLLAELEKRLISRMMMIIVEYRSRLKEIPEMPRAMAVFLKDKKHRFSLAMNALEQLSPLSIMKRGYAIVKSADDRIVKQIDDVLIDQDINVLVSDGTLSCTVHSKTRGEGRGKTR